MKNRNTKKEKRQIRRNRVRAKVFGTAMRPRFSVFKSSKAIYGQIIDDNKGITLCSVSSLKNKEKGLLNKAKTSGVELAKTAKTKGISDVVFDRGGYVYTGVIKAFAEGAREGGLNF